MASLSKVIFTSFFILGNSFAVIGLNIIKLVAIAETARYLVNTPSIVMFSDVNLV
jgi:hypothetical protein